MPLASHTMKTATQSYALRLIAESVAAPRTDFESCVKSQAVGPRENPCNFCQSVASDGKKRFSTLFGKEKEINEGFNHLQESVTRAGLAAGHQRIRSKQRKQGLDRTANSVPSNETRTGPGSSWGYWASPRVRTLRSSAQPL